MEEKKEHSVARMLSPVTTKKGGKYYWWQYCVRDYSNRSTSLYPTLHVPATENGDERTACWCCDLNQQHDNDRAGM